MNEHRLQGLDGQHLWGFLTSLGTLSVLDQHARLSGEAAPRLAFDNHFTARIHTHLALGDVPQALRDGLKEIRRELSIYFKDIKKPADITRDAFSQIALIGPERIVDMLAGLASVVGDTTYESTLCAANGSSAQNLVQSMLDVLDLAEPKNLEEAILLPWTRSFQVSSDTRRTLDLGNRKPTLRLDPADERLYALRFSNPTTSDDYKTEIGAQALAVPAYALLPVVPGKRPVTVSSKRARQRVTFSWMLWHDPATLQSVRSFVWGGVEHPARQRARGAFAAFSADRVSGAKGKLSFAPSQGVW
jgi:hypothetical protein